MWCASFRYIWCRRWESERVKRFFLFFIRIAYWRFFVLCYAFFVTINPSFGDLLTTF